MIARWMKGKKFFMSVIGTLALATTILAGVFEWGRWTGESQILAELAKAEGSIAELRIKLDREKALTKSQAVEINLLQGEVRAKESKLSLQSKQLASLSDSAGRTDNCAFVYQQIQKTEQEIDDWVSTSLSVSKAEAEEKADKAIFERRLQGYQQQLGTCRS